MGDVNRFDTYIHSRYRHRQTDVILRTNFFATKPADAGSAKRQTRQKVLWTLKHNKLQKVVRCVVNRYFASVTTVYLWHRHYWMLQSPVPMMKWDFLLPQDRSSLHAVGCCCRLLPCQSVSHGGEQFSVLHSTLNLSRLQLHGRTHAGWIRRWVGASVTALPEHHR